LVVVVVAVVVVVNEPIDMERIMDFFTYDGKIAFPDSSPSIRSIAISLSRECRYAGASLYWWPVALHTFVVCDLLPPALKIHGLLHDAAECVTGDIPKPAKTKDIAILENEILWSIYKQLGIAPTTIFDDQSIHNADCRALHGEVHTVGTLSLRDLYPLDPEAMQLVWKYFKLYSPLDCIDADGPCVKEFLRRFGEYKTLS
jgi:hypothetical protein